MIAIDIEQGTQQWLQARSGIPTASNFNKIIDSKGNRSKQALKYMQRLAAERVSGIVEEGYKNDNMQRGNETEQEAINFYELVKEVKVTRVGLCYQDEDKKFSCSPDALVGEDGGLEIKCPIGSTQVEYLLDGKVPTTYFQQIQGNLFVTGRKWWHFLSYYPGMRPLLIRVERDEVFIAALKHELELFCYELETIVERIK